MSDLTVSIMDIRNDLSKEGKVIYALALDVVVEQIESLTKQLEEAKAEANNLRANKILDSSEIKRLSVDLESATNIIAGSLEYGNNLEAEIKALQPQWKKRDYFVGFEEEETYFIKTKFNGIIVSTFLLSDELMESYNFQTAMLTIPIADVTYYAPYIEPKPPEE